MEEACRLAVFGRPVEHSLSPRVHGLFAVQAGVRVSYEPILVEEGAFARTADRFLVDGAGFNVTLPCKQDAYLYVAQRSDAAEKARAVNTVSVSNGIVHGDNTDGRGLVTDLTSNLGWKLAGARILVLGAGGAVSGVLADILAEGPEQVHLHNRTHGKAMKLVALFDDTRLAAKTSAGLGRGYDLVINGTSAGLSSKVPAIADGVISAASRCYDMLYGSLKTPFMAWCLERSACGVSDGLGMLVEQAALSFNIWVKKSVATKPVIAQLREEMRRA